MKYKAFVTEETGEKYPRDASGKFSVKFNASHH